MRPNKIVIHHTAGHDNPGLDFDNIEAYHRDGRGWSDIGYHGLVELVDGVYVQIMGRMWDRQGAHCQGENDHTLGLAFVGNFEETEVPPAQRAAMLEWVAFACRILNLPARAVVGHNEIAHSPTACPGKNLDMNKFRADLGAMLLG